MFASTLFADEADVRDFERQIEALMRAGQADEAAAIVAAALGELARAGQPLASLCLATRDEAVTLAGWERLAERIAELDAAGATITAIGIDMSWPGHVGLEPDAAGLLEPCLETSYYSDTAFAFSTSTRAEILDGYGAGPGAWTGGFEDIDYLIESRGLGEVYGAVAPLVERLRHTSGGDPLEADAMRLGAVFVAVQVHRAVRRAIASQGLPRELAVIVGSNESYPFLSAPVTSAEQSGEFIRSPAPTEAPPAEDTPETLVPLLSQEPRTEPPSVEDAPEALVPLLPQEPQHPSGATLRQRINALQPANDEAEASLADAGAPRGLLRRLLRR